MKGLRIRRRARRTETEECSGHKIEKPEVGRKEANPESHEGKADDTRHQGKTIARRRGQEHGTGRAEEREETWQNVRPGRTEEGRSKDMEGQQTQTKRQCTAGGKQESCRAGEGAGDAGRPVEGARRSTYGTPRAEPRRRQGTAAGGRRKKEESRRGRRKPVTASGRAPPPQGKGESLGPGHEMLNPVFQQVGVVGADDVGEGDHVHPTRRVEVTVVDPGAVFLPLLCDSGCLEVDMDRKAQGCGCAQVARASRGAPREKRECRRIVFAQRSESCS